MRKKKISNKNMFKKVKEMKILYKKLKNLKRKIILIKSLIILFLKKLKKLNHKKFKMNIFLSNKMKVIGVIKS